ncbi:MAG: hypothetical protein MMC33_003600 [Icmadophila ericetorum]|nr:hypothetical protein [Icmadophila ericetorum]
MADRPRPDYEAYEYAPPAYQPPGRLNNYAPQSPLKSGKLFGNTGYYPLPPEHHQFEQMRYKDSNLKRNIRIFRVIARTLSLLLASFTTYAQSQTLHKYLSTRSTYIDSRTAWADDTTIWPTIVLLATSGLTLFISAGIMVGYCWSVGHANAVSNTVGTAGTVLEIGAHLIVWIGTAAAYKIGKTGSDLWGWSCSDKADSIQAEFKALVDFNHFCNIQTGSWFASIAQAGLAIVVAAVYILAWRRQKHKQRLEQTAAMLQNIAV